MSFMGVSELLGTDQGCDEVHQQADHDHEGDGGFEGHDSTPHPRRPRCVDVDGPLADLDAILTPVTGARMRRRGDDGVMDTSWIRTSRSLLVTVAIVLPLAWCAGAAHLTLTAPTDALVLVLLVVGTAATGDRLAGLAAAVSAGVWFDFFLTAPFHRLAIDDADDIEVTVLLVVVGAAVTEIVLWGRRQQAGASRRSGYLDGVLATSQLVAGGLSSSELAEQVSSRLAELLGADRVRFVPGPAVDAARPVLTPDGEITVRGHLLDADRDGLPTMDETAIPARHHGVVHGQFLVTAATTVVRPTAEQRRVAVLLADQVGAAHATSTPNPL